MQERVIENWLTNANELSFTIPYSQVLALQGHRILHISPKKATLEQGKDIISVDRAGVVHCYQLKGEDVTLDRWRRELKPEVEAMIELPPRHPSLRKDTDWVCHLVVNGEFKGEATREIADFQHAREASGRKSFDTVVRGQLLRAFADVYGSYLPRELDDFTAFMDLYREDGLEPVNKAKLAQLLEGFFGQAFAEGSKRPSRNAIRQQINAAVVSVSYLLANKYRQKSYIAALEGWLLLLGYVLAVAERNDLSEKYWLPSVRLIEQIVDETVEDLLGELDERVHYAQPTTVPYADAYVYKARVTIVASYLAAYCMYRRIMGEASSAEPRVRAFLDKTVDLRLLEIKGEGQIVLIAIVALFYHLIGETEQAAELLVACVGIILAMRDKGGMYDPYVDIQDIIRSELRITLTPVERNVRGNSYVLLPLILLLAHMGQRDVLASVWRNITHVGLQEFKPAEPWQWFLWTCAHGRQEGRFAEQEQSWRELVTFAHTPDATVMPEFLREEPCYIPLFFCLMPHRMSGYATRTLIASLPPTNK